MKTLNGKTVVLTAGPTYEPIDPVRFIGNHSTGKMGFALAASFAEIGANVYLVSGPTNQKLTTPAIQLISVTTAAEMFKETQKLADKADIMVFAAAVADYRPETVSETKIKKNDENLTIKLVKNVDIAATLGKSKRSDQFFVGFALETDNEEIHAQQKLQKKNLDMIVLNSLNDPGAGFKHNTNKITIIEKDKITKFDLKEKSEVAQDIVSTILERIHV